ncbi:uncharacterized protein LOC135217756 isoform X3 [Macrobrachium nipponense]|uniref:uncharacterized protein LOC135217756 isoform X3 n=1 Tax=Macrobrachium nipponense TaxID=159736 RepID=UPI0030C853CE
MTASSYVFLAITVAAVLIYGLPTAYSTGPNFVGHVKSVKANEGETVSFTCQIKNLSNYRQVAWYRLHPKRPLSIGTDILSGDQRLTVIPDGSMKWTLQIAKVTRHDRGKYQCAVIFSKRVSSQVASLKVRGVTQTSYVGCNNVVPFVVPYPSEDIAWITVRRKTSPWNPLLIKSPIRNDLAAYETSDSWHKSVEYGFCDGLVEVRLRNVTYDLEDTYYCIVEFKNSSSCFSHVNLRVTEKNPGGECSFIWNPRKTVLTWNTFRQRLANVTVLDNLIPKGAEVDEAFTLQTCPTNVISCQETQKMKSCISSRFRRRLNTVCVRVPNEDDIMKLEVEYEEDDECECGIREFSQRTTNDVILAGTKLIDIKRAKHVGNCPGQCRPKRVKVKWPYIRDVITKETPYRIPPFLPGKNIWVRQCPVDSTICDEAGKKCRATGYKEKTKKILLTAYKRLFIIDYLLAKNCKCRREDAVDPHESQLFILKNFTSLPLR